jgi:hypothetical protein
VIWESRAGEKSAKVVLVFAPKFPANREINKEFCKIRPSTPIFGADRHAKPIACNGIPYATEQGISKRVSGNFFQGTGNLIGGTAD